MGKPLIDIYSVGLCNMSLCAESSLDKESIEDLANRMYPTGISSKWCISDNKTFSDGSPMPNICEEDSTRLHWLLHC